MSYSIQNGYQTKYNFEDAKGMEFRIPQLQELHHLLLVQHKMDINIAR